MSEIAASHEPTNAQSTAALVRHTRREEWGRALLLWRREEKRAYQFEDGEMRVFAERFSSFLQPARRPDPVLRHQLRTRAAADGHIEAGVGKRGAKSSAPVPTLEDQIALFATLYEGTFAGDAWAQANRVRPGSRRLKRHRDPAIEEAKTRLAFDTLKTHIDAGEPQRVMDEILDVVANTDLATRKQLEPLRAIAVDATLAQAAINFLHDVAGPQQGPLDNLRVELAKRGHRKLSWTTITAARALVRPAQHIYVRPSVLRAQAKLLAPQFKLSSVPTPDVYSRCLEIVLSARDQLVDAGLQPRDLFDVVDFMRVTLARGVREDLIATMVKRQASAGATAQQPPTVH